MPSLTDHTERVQKVALSPQANLLASASYDKQIILWDTKRGLPGVTFKPGCVAYTLEFTPDSRLLLAAGEDGIVRAYSMATHHLAWQFEAHAAPIWCLAVSPDGKVVCSGDEAGNVITWEVANRQVIASHQVHQGKVEALAWIPSGKVIASTGRDPDGNLVKVWNPLTGEVFWQRGRLSQWVNGLAWSPIGNRYLALAIASVEMGELDHALEVWDVLDNVLEMSYPIPGYGQAVAWLDNGTKLLVALAHGPCVFVAFHQDEKTILDVLDCSRFLTDMVMSSDGRVLVTAHDDGAVLVRLNQQNSVQHPAGLRKTRLAVVVDDKKTKQSAAVAKRRLLDEQQRRTAAFLVVPKGAESHAR